MKEIMFHHSDEAALPGCSVEKKDTKGNKMHLTYGQIKEIIHIKME